MLKLDPSYLRSHLPAVFNRIDCTLLASRFFEQIARLQVAMWRLEHETRNSRLRPCRPRLHHCHATGYPDVISRTSMVVFSPGVKLYALLWAAN